MQEWLEAQYEKFTNHGFENIIAPSRDELDLFDRNQVKNFLREIKPDQIFLACCKSWWNEANSTNKHLFLHENLLIQNNVIYEAQGYVKI